MSLIETPSRIEPSLLDEANAEVLDLVAELSRASGALDNRLHPRSAANLADLVRVMNCYYSNLIEGHTTTPREIERPGAVQDPERARFLAVDCADAGRRFGERVTDCFNDVLAQSGRNAI